MSSKPGSPQALKLLPGTDLNHRLCNDTVDKGQTTPELDIANSLFTWKFREVRCPGSRPLQQNSDG